MRGVSGDVRLRGTAHCHPATPHRLAAELPSRGAILYPHRVYFGPGGGNVGRGKNPLRKMQHSCIF